MIDKQPKICNICGGKVIWTEHPKKEGNKCYLCTQCGAYVSVHKRRPKEAMGCLANEETRQKRIEVHRLFDRFWKTQTYRRRLYKRLAYQLGIDERDCHFAFMTLDMLLKAEQILLGWWREKYDK